MSAAQRHDDLTPDTIALALGFIDPNVSREKWWRIAAALKSELGDSGYSLFEDWSRTGDDFDLGDCRSTWKSTRDGGGVNIGTLIWEAQQQGFAFDADRPTLDADAVAARRAAREAEQKAAEAELRRIHGEAAKLANLTWEAATPAGDAHPYLVGKGVRAHGLGLGEWPLINDKGEIFRRLPDALLIPINDARNGKVISLQGILVDMDGSIQKRYLKNGRKRGGFHMIGTPPADAGGIVAFCEGYATGATIHALTGWCVIVTFDAPNLTVVAEAMREQFPQAAFIIAADNDAWSKVGDIENPGLHYANRAAANTRGCMIAPAFADTSTRPTDWNDLATLEGDHAARAQLLANPVSAASTAVAAAGGGDGGPPANDNVDYFTPLPDLGGKGKPLATIENLAEIIDRLGVTVRYNMIAKDTEIMIPGEQFLADTRRGSSLARMKSQCVRFGMPTEPLGEYLLYLSDQRPFNPVVQWITSQPWDGVSRFADLLATVETREDFDRDLWALLLRRWLISAVAAAFKPSGFWSKGVLVFQGPQSEGKTSWFRALVPDDLRDLIKVDATIDPNNKDSVISAVSHWLVEIGELDGTLRKADIARLKGFISQDVDLFRRPYARTEESFQRRTVFFASVNPEQFLADDTGNVRWWTIPIVGLLLDQLRQMDVQQLWAEVATWHAAGEQWWLDKHEEARLEARNAHHAQAHPVEEIITARYGGAPENSLRKMMTATQVLLAIGFDKPNRDQQTNAAAALRKLFGDAKKTNAGRFFSVPDLPSEGRSGRFSAPDDDERPF